MKYLSKPYYSTAGTRRVIRLLRNKWSLGKSRRCTWASTETRNNGKNLPYHFIFKKLLADSAAVNHCSHMAWLSPLQIMFYLEKIVLYYLSFCTFLRSSEAKKKKQTGKARRFSVPGPTFINQAGRKVCTSFKLCPVLRSQIVASSFPACRNGAISYEKELLP